MIKHSKKAAPEQARHLTDTEKCAACEHRYEYQIRKPVTYNILVGGGMKRMFKDVYMAAKKAARYTSRSKSHLSEKNQEVQDQIGSAFCQEMRMKPDIDFMA